MKKIVFSLVVGFFSISMINCKVSAHDLDTVYDDGHVEEYVSEENMSLDGTEELPAVEGSNLQDESFDPEIPDDLEYISDGNMSRKIIGSDNRKLVSNTTSYPFSSVVYLIMKFPNGKSYIGSGNLISNNMVLTAGHCIYKSSLGGWATQVTAYPGFNGKTAPFGAASASKLMSVSGWTSKESSEHDIGAIKLDRKIGEKAGYLGLTTNTNSTITLTGFHGDLNGKMGTESGSIFDLTSNNVFYKLDSTGGSSGSGVYNNNKQILAVHAYGSDSYNFGTRINNEKFNVISKWRLEMVPIKVNKMVTIKTANYTLWQNLTTWKKKSDTSDKLGNTYKVKYEYNHPNGSVYYSLYDAYDNWTGYINKTGIQELKAEKFNKKVSIKREDYSIWQNFFWKKKSDTKGKLGKVYNAKYKYKHYNGATYYSLYDGSGAWQGYINATGTIELNAVSYNKKVTITKGTYDIWQNFFFNTKKGNTSTLVGKIYDAKYTYTLGNGVMYYSLYDGDTWIGYLNKGATQLVKNSIEINSDYQYEESESSQEENNNDTGENIDPINIEEEMKQEKEHAEEEMKQEKEDPEEEMEQEKEDAEDEMKHEAEQKETAPTSEVTEEPEEWIPPANEN